MSVGTYVAVCVVLFVASTVQASSGFGQGLIATPLLRLLHPALLPGPIVMVGLVTAVIVARRNSEKGDLNRVAPALGGRVVGAMIAWGLLLILSERGLTISIGVMVFGFVVLRLLDVGLPLGAATLAGAGVASGIGGTIAALGGAPIALLFQQHANARDFRGALGWYTVIGGSMSIVILALAGRIDSTAIINALLMLPPIVVGARASHRLTPLLDGGYLRPLVLGLSGTSAVVLILGELL